MSGDRVNQAIPSFINGVSQQPASVRMPSQCELLENALPTVSDGLRKRPPTAHMTRLWNSGMDDAFVHLIDRDAYERYMVFIVNGDLKVVDLFDNGRELHVEFPDGKLYLENNLPREGFVVATVADYSFIVNKSVTVRMLPDTTPAAPNEAVVFVKGAYTATTYIVTVDGNEVSHKTAGANEQPDTKAIAEALKSGIEEHGFAVEQNGSVLLVKKPDGSDFTFSTSDSWGEQALVGIKRTVAKTTDLPAKCFDGVKVKITGESKGTDDDYYVEWDSEGGTRGGTWDECRGWDMPTDLDPATMPHVLIREADGTFTFKPAEWDPAKVGDDDSVPPPSFIDRKINSVFFFKNRLGFLSDENVILSRDTYFFNFWPKTASTVVATDPIDYAASYEKVSILNHAIQFRDALLLFSEHTQFQFGNGNASTFAPDTVRMDITTQYGASPRCAPVGAGSNVYFITEDGDNSAVMEYFMQVDGVTNDATDVSSHAPRYIPAGVFKMISSTGEDYLMLLSTRERNVVWVYKYFWVNTDKVQSAWSRWVFPESDAILSIANASAEIYLVVQRSDGVYLERMHIQSMEPDEGMDFLVHLDRKASVYGGYDPETHTTFWTPPYPVTEDDHDYTVVIGGGFPGKAGRELPVTIVGGRLTAPGRYSAAPCFIGRQYPTRLRLSELFVRESRDVAAAVLAGGRLQILKMTVLIKDSGYFRSEVRAKGRDVKIAEHLGVIGDGNFRVGKAVIDSLPHRFMVLAKSNQVVIDIVVDKHFPVNLLSAEWEGLFNLDAQRL